MQFHLTIFGKDPLVEGFWIKKITDTSRSIVEVKITAGSEVKEPQDMGQIVFVDADHPKLDAVLAGISRTGRAIYLLVPENAPVPAALSDGRVDDVLVHPFRPLEFLSKLYRFQQILMWDEVQKLNASFSDLIGRIQGDLQLAERMQKTRLEMRFPEIKGFKVSNRYLAGGRSGGDYFDIAESPGRNLVTMVLSDSSTYGLSSQVLNVMMRVAVKLSSDETRSSLETVKRIHDELAVTLGDKDQLSLFYGVVSRKDYRLRYVHLGGSSVFYSDPKGKFQLLPGCGPAISRTGGLQASAEQECLLKPEGRLILMTDGYVEAMGGVKETLELLDSFREQEAVNTLNELVFRVKSKLESEDDLPSQDCTVSIFDLDAKLLRLA